MTDPVFFEAARRFTAGEVAMLTGAVLRDDTHAGIEITGIAPAAEGGVGRLIFVDGRKNRSLLASANAAAVLCQADLADDAPAGLATLVSPRPHFDFALIGRLMFPSAARPATITGETGISPAAHVDPSARIEAGAIVEAGAVIAAGVHIGSGSIIAPNAVIGSNCQIGRDGYVGPGVTLQCALVGDRVIIHPGAQIGQDGFGYVAGAGGAEKVPQIGRVVIQDDVEIGPNTTIDRGSLSDTVIGAGTKIDNLVQIAHNVRIGRNCLIAGHCGLSGSVTLGDGVMLGGRVGLSDHVTVGNGAAIAAASGVMHDIPAGEKWCGVPAQPIRDFFREQAMIRKLASGRGKRGDGNE